MVMKYLEMGTCRPNKRKFKTQRAGGRGDAVDAVDAVGKQPREQATCEFLVWWLGLPTNLVNR